jgi:hypothetical protein
MYRKELAGYMQGERQRSTRGYYLSNRLSLSLGTRFPDQSGQKLYRFIIGQNVEIDAVIEFESGEHAAARDQHERRSSTWQQRPCLGLLDYVIQEHEYAPSRKHVAE